MISAAAELRVGAAVTGSAARFDLARFSGCRQEAVRGTGHAAETQCVGEGRRAAGSWIHLLADRSREAQSGQRSHNLLHVAGPRPLRHGTAIRTVEICAIPVRHATAKISIALLLCFQREARRRPRRKRRSLPDRAGHEEQQWQAGAHHESDLRWSSSDTADPASKSVGCSQLRRSV